MRRSGIGWTVEARRRVEHAPRLLRPLIRRRVEAQAFRDGRKVIDDEYVEALRERRMGVGGAGEAEARPAPESPPGGPGEELKEDVAFLAALVARYCEHHHASGKRRAVERRGRAGEALPPGEWVACEDCRRLLLHGIARRLACPRNPKSPCRACETPCHHPDYRRRIARIMRWSMDRAP